MRSLLKIGMIPECEQLLATVKVSQQGRNNKQQITALESEIALTKGEITSPQAIVCPAGEENGKTVLLWEIRGGELESNNGNKKAEFLGRDFPKLDGRWDLELLVLTPPNTETRLALIPKAKARGKWTGKLPEGIVSIQAVLRSPAGKKGSAGGPSYEGTWIPALSGSNLIVNPGFEGLGAAPAASGTSNAIAPVKGWEKAPNGAIQPGGPRPGGSQIALQFPTNNQSTLNGEKIPVQKGKEYLQTLWLRGDNFANVGVRFLDQEGKQVGNVQFDSLNNGNQGRWVYCTQILTTVGGTNKRRIPEKAAFLQPYVETCGNVWIDNFFLGEIAAPQPVATGSAAASPAPAPIPLALACPAGQENGNPLVLWEIRPCESEPNRNQDRYDIVGRDEPTLDGHYDLELLYLTPPNSVQRLALIPKAKSRGKWNGKLPGGLGSIQAVLRPATLAKAASSAPSFPGAWVPVVNAPNLLTNPGFEATQPEAKPESTGTDQVAAAPAPSPAPDATPSPTPSPTPAGPLVKGWENLPPITLHPGGPRPGGAMVDFHPPSQKAVIVTGDKIPWKKDKNYTFTCWFLPYNQRGSNSPFGMRFLDKDGKTIRTEMNRSGSSIGKWCLRVLSTASKNSPGNRRARMSESVAYIQPIIEVRGEFALDSLFLGETDAPQTSREED
jgi:hypothetical protein